MKKQELNIQLTREEILSVYAQGPDKVIELIENLILVFTNHINQQTAVIQKLQERLKKLEHPI